MAQGRGFLGPGPPDPHLDHASAFATAWPGPEPPAVGADLGSGAGLPGLVLALTWAQSSWHLIESNRRRGAFLVEAVAELGLVPRVQVHVTRAEELGRDRGRRGGQDLVVARAFGPPAVTAECAAPLLRPGGCLLVSEPPGPDGGRWPASGLAPLGLVVEGLVRTTAAIVVLRQEGPCSERFPRRAPHRRPLF